MVWERSLRPWQTAEDAALSQTSDLKKAESIADRYAAIDAQIDVCSLPDLGLLCLTFCLGAGSETRGGVEQEVRSSRLCWML